LNVYDPYQNPTRYKSVPVLLSYCDPTVSPGDTTINPAQNTGFATAVNAIGGSVTLQPSLTSTCTHISQDQFTPSAFVNFLKPLVATNNTTQFGGTPNPVQTKANTTTFPAINLAPIVVSPVGLITTGTGGAWVTVMTFPPNSLAPWEIVKVDCTGQYAANFTATGVSFRLTGFTGSGSSGDASMQTNLAAGASTEFTALGVASAGFLTFTGSSSVTSGSNYRYALRGVIRNGNAAGALSLQFQSTNATYVINLANAIASSCTMTPANVN
jgi:hypothetical protein